MKRWTTLICPDCGGISDGPVEHPSTCRCDPSATSYSLVQVVALSEVREALLGAGAEKLAQCAYERVITELPRVTPRWDDADERVRAGFIAQARSDLDHFALPAAFPSDSEGEPK